MRKPKVGTLIRLRYQISMCDEGLLADVDADAGREFVVIECNDTEAGHVCVVEPDQYEEGADYTQDHLIIDDLDAIQEIGRFA